MPKAVEECVKSVLDDNPEYSEDRAYAICQAMRNRGELSISDDPSHDELLTAVAQQDIDCPEGHVHTGSQCVPIEEVRDAPPSVVDMSEAVFALSSVDTEPIEREELGENKVAYRNLKILSPGQWTDSNSRETIWYSPKGLEGLEVAEDNAVNIMHDADNQVSEAGHIDPDSVEATEDGLFADVIIDTSNAAGEYADKNLQKTLETQGAKGFGGPSVEIDAQGQDVEYNENKGMRELLGGIISGLGFVKNPASKPVSFARQTAQRGVALSDSDQSVMRLKSEQRDMADVSAQEFAEFFASMVEGADVADVTDMMDELGEFDGLDQREIATLVGDAYNTDTGTVLDILEQLGGAEEGRENQEDEEDQPGGDEEDAGDDEEDDEEEEMDMETRIETLEERLTNVEDMVESVMAAEELEEELSELADAETVEELEATLSELEETKEDLEKRLSELEDEPEQKSLADRDENGDEPKNVQPVARHDKVRGTTSRR